MGLFKSKGAVSGPKMTDAEIYKAVTNYSGGAKPKQTKTQKVTHQAFAEVYGQTPKIVKHTAAKFGAGQAEKQRVAIALSKARKAGARIPKK